MKTLLIISSTVYLYLSTYTGHNKSGYTIQYLKRKSIDKPIITGGIYDSENKPLPISVVFYKKIRHEANDSGLYQINASTGTHSLEARDVNNEAAAAKNVKLSLGDSVIINFYLTPREILLIHKTP